jgi:hypothetical protein
MDLMSYFRPPIAQKNHSTGAAAIKAPIYSGTTTLIAVAALGLGIGLAFMSAFGVDPTNEPQRLDFEHFHRPSILLFADRPFTEAIADYPAAPFPLFYILAGWIHWAADSMFAVQAWNILLGLALLLCAFALARARFGRSWPHTLLLLAAVSISPYFRGQSVYANTDILALLLAFGAVLAFGEETPRFPSRRAVLALALACLSVYTRQFYVFLPFYFFIRLYATSSWQARISTAILCAALAIPVVALVALWGGVTPPRFREHAAAPSLDASIPAVIILLSFYAVPLALVTAWHYRDKFLADVCRPGFQVLAAPFLLLGLYLLLHGGGPPDVVGGGIPLHALNKAPVPDGIRSVLLAVGVAVGGTYLAYLVRQDVLRNGIVVLIALCFFSTGILYQRYFDPLMPLVYSTVLSTREMSARSSMMSLALIAAMEVFVAAVGFVHYRAVFWGAG